MIGFFLLSVSYLGVLALDFLLSAHAHENGTK